MKKSIIFLSVVFLSNLALNSSAQTDSNNAAMNGKPAFCSLLTYGLEVGVTMFSLRNSYNGEVNNDYNKIKPGFHVAATAMYPLMGAFFILTMLDFTMKGTKYDYTSGDYWIKDRVSLFYLQLPILLAYTFATFNEYTFSALFGPYLGLGLWGKSKHESNYPNNEDGTDKLKYGKDNYQRRGDFGLNFGVMVVRGLWTFRLAYQLGLKNVYPNVDSDSKRFNRGGNISVGYRFNCHK